MVFKNKTTLDMDNLPKHIAIIMDGNGRWAEKRGLSREVGHREGSRSLKKIVQACYEMGIQYLTIYAFSTENWNRPKKEVDSLMKLMMEYLKNAENELKGKNVRIRVIGDKQGLSKELVDEINRVEAATAHFTQMTFLIAINYGGRQDIVDAITKMFEDIKAGRQSEKDIDINRLSEYLYTSGVPDPDLLIRTSGELRLSNFLIWQCSYSEFYFTEVLWPDFTVRHLEEAIMHYQRRQRRYGGL